MLSQDTLSENSFSLQELFPKYTNLILEPFQDIIDPDILNGKYLDFVIEGRIDKKRINPIIRKATPEDIDEIIFIYKDIYENTYPYKEMEDKEELLKMLNNPNFEWLVFETKDHEIVGCFTFILDFNKKLGNIRGFNLKKKFLGKLDIMKMAMGSIIAMYKKYNDKIFSWYGECRTAHSKSQYFLSALGFKPVGFYPCKDIFYNKVESDLLILSYDERALTTMRSKKIPTILPEALNGFLYSDNRYTLGSCELVEANKLNVRINYKKVKELEKRFTQHITKDKFGYESIKFTFKNSDSFFEFLYTPTVQNFEKTNYKVESIEELYVFVQEFINYGKIYCIRYCEAFVSAYNPTHQKIFSEFGLSPRGYVPSWKYNQYSNEFEDCILFNWYEGAISSDIQLLQEGKDLLKILGLHYSYEPIVIQEKKSTSSVVYSLKERLPIINLTNIIRSSIITGLFVYLALLFSSLGIAALQGYKITTHTISELALSTISPIPFLFDFSCVIGGLISVLLYYQLSQGFGKFTPFIKYSMITGFLGSMGIMCVGIFSLERAHLLLHGIFSVQAFSGFIISISAFSLHLSRYNLYIRKLFIINGVMPIFSVVFYFLFATPLTEWIMLLSILFSLIPLFCWNTFQK